MTTQQRLERDLPAILGELALAPYPDYIDDVLSTTAARGQRPRWTFPERWLPVELTTQRVPQPSLPWRAVGALALIAILIASAVAIYVGTRPRLPDPFGPAANGLVSYERGGAIYLFDPATDTARVLTTDAEGWIDPWFSPDGRQLLLAREVSNSQVEFGILSVDGGEIRVVTPHPVQGGDWIEWSPDGRSLVLLTTVLKDADRLKMLTPAVAIIDVATATMTILETGPNPTDVSFVPPVGDRLLVQAETPTRGNVLTLMDLDGSNPETLVETTSGFQIVGRPDISPDGGTLAYAVWDVTERHGTIRLRDLATGVERIAGDGPGVTSTIWPRFSPDGTKIAAEQWVTVDGVQHQTLVVIDTITDAVVAAQVDVPNGAAMEWSPDGRFLVVSPSDVDRARLPHLLVDPVSGEAQPAPWDATSYPSWQRLAP